MFYPQLIHSFCGNFKAVFGRTGSDVLGAAFERSLSRKTNLSPGQTSFIQEQGLAARAVKLNPTAHNRIATMAQSNAQIIARRRPKRSDKNPKRMPPIIAPTIEIAVTAIRWAGPNPQ